jgi:hypothetical protein
VSINSELLWFIGMNIMKHYNIRHQFFYLQEDGEECLMILLMLENNKVVMIGTTSLPVWHRFYDEKYKYYPLCHN